MNTFTVLSSPSNCITSRCASTRTCDLVCASSRSVSSPRGKARSGWTTIEPVGTVAVLATTTVRSASVARIVASAPATSWSNAMSTSTEPDVALFDGWGSVRDSRTSLTTGPAFCDSPVWSSPRTWKPCSIAAVPSTCDVVTTPVPPMPLNRMVSSSTPAERGAGMMVGATGSDRTSAFPRAGADLHEGGAIALQTREVEVARTLVDAGLAAERGVDRVAPRGSCSCRRSRRSPRTPAR